MEGDVLYKREVEGAKVASKKIFDFSESAYGVYNVKVKLDGESSEQLVTVTETGVQVGEILRKTVPIFTFNDNLLKLSFMNQSKDGMTLKVYSEGELIWEKELDNSAQFIRKFDLSKLDKGDYQVVFSAGKDTYEYQLIR